MRFDVMTLFPDIIEYITGSSIIGRAQAAGILEIYAHNIRDYSQDKHRRVDDTPYGGGMGMLMAAPPVYSCYGAVKALTSDIPDEKRRVVYMSPQGKVLTQKHAAELAEYDQIVILCGHYEGIDERVLDEIVDEEISVGDYVLTGGEIPACLLIDCIGRLKEGVLSSPECYEMESIACGMLEYPQYTRPYEFHGKAVPEILLSGNHAQIEKWRYDAALERTMKKRPDLL